MEARIRRGLLVAATLAVAGLLAVQVVVPMLWAADFEIEPEPGPSAVGVPTNPQALPDDTASQTPAPGREVPRLYPDSAGFEHEKDRANAEATMTATPREAP